MIWENQQYCSNETNVPLAVFMCFNEHQLRLVLPYSTVKTKLDSLFTPSAECTTSELRSALGVN